MGGEDDHDSGNKQSNQNRIRVIILAAEEDSDGKYA